MAIFRQQFQVSRILDSLAPRHSVRDAQISVPPVETSSCWTPGAGSQ